MHFLKELFILFLATLLFVVGFSFYVCFVYMKPRRFVSEFNPQHFNLVPFEDVSLNTDDGITLRGWYIPSPKATDKAIIVCHGYPMDKGNVLSFCPMFYDNYNILMFDFRGLGQSGGGFTSIGLNETKDLEAAVNYLKGRGVKRIGALGFSMGGAVIIMANNPDIRAAVSDSAFTELSEMVEVVYGNFGPFRHIFTYFTKIISKLVFRLDILKVSPMTAVKNFKAPLFLIHGQEDSQIDASGAKLLHQASPNSELWIVPSAEHGETHSLYPDKYKEKVLSFFEKNMRKSD
jgi:hypothetical protein